MADEKDTTRAVVVRNAKRRGKRPALELAGEKLPRITVEDYTAMSPLKIGALPGKKKPAL